jgi:hypothetical protein
MNKFFLFLFLSVLFTVFLSCLTAVPELYLNPVDADTPVMVERVEESNSRPSFTGEDENLVGTLVINDRKSITLSIQNKTAEVIILDINITSFTDKLTGFNSRLIEGNTKLIDASRLQPPIVLAPQSKIYKVFMAADSVEYSDSEEKAKLWKGITNWVPVNLSESIFIFGYRIQGEENYLTFQN